MVNLTKKEVKKRAKGMMVGEATYMKEVTPQGAHVIKMLDMQIWLQSKLLQVLFSIFHVF